MVWERTLVPDRTQLLARGWQFLPARSFWGYRSLLLTDHEAARPGTLAVTSVDCRLEPTQLSSV